MLSTGTARRLDGPIHAAFGEETPIDQPKGGGHLSGGDGGLSKAEDLIQQALQIPHGALSRASNQSQSTILNRVALQAHR